MRYFCTYFDHRYLTRGLALYQSLRHYCSEFRLWVLCMDELSYRILTRLNLPEMSLITLAEFERDDSLLREAKANRSAIEFYFTCTPSLPLFIMRDHPDVNAITYLDADLFFFADVSPIFEEMGSNSIIIVGIVTRRVCSTMRYMAFITLACFRFDGMNTH